MVTSYFVTHNFDVVEASLAVDREDLIEEFEFVSELDARMWIEDYLYRKTVDLALMLDRITEYRCHNQHKIMEMS